MPLHGGTKIVARTSSTVKRFDGAPTSEARALQIYLILLGLAQRRQTIHYKELAILMGYSAEGSRGYQFLGQFLGYVLAWCTERNLPPLNILVVNQRDGVPSFMGNGYGIKDLPALWKRVFDEPWYEYYPPAFKELESARQWAVKRDWRFQ